VEGFKSDWNEVKLRGIAFYPNSNTSSWCASSSEEYNSHFRPGAASSDNILFLIRWE